MRLRVEVRDLRIGDVLIPTNRTVIGPYGASRGVRTPRGKTDVDLQRPDGTVQRATFGTYTSVTIERT